MVQEVYHVEFIPGAEAASRAAAGGTPRAGTSDQSPPPADPCSSYHVLVASSESLFVWDVLSERMMQKADAPGTAGSSLTPEGSAALWGAD